MCAVRARGEESHPHWSSQEVTSDLKLGMEVRVKQTKTNRKSISSRGNKRWQRGRTITSAMGITLCPGAMNSHKRLISRKQVASQKSLRDIKNTKSQLHQYQYFLQ